MITGTKLRNIGPKSAAWLRQTGVRSQEDLEAVGALAAYVRVKRAGFKPSLNLLYALEGANPGLPLAGNPGVRAEPNWSPPPARKWPSCRCPRASACRLPAR